MRLTTKKFSYLHVLALFLAVFVGVASSFFIPDVHALNGAGERLITIHDRGQERGLITKADTLREVFEEANIPLDKNDLVEPGVDEKLVSNNYQVNVYRARPVVIVDGQVQQLVMSAYQTPKQIAKHAGIELQDEDTAALDLSSNFVRDGASIRLLIDRASPVELTLYGKTETVYTQSTTIQDFLKEKKITIDEKDTLSVDEAETIKAGMKVEVWRNGKQTVTKEESINFNIQQIQDTDREIGYKKVNTPGVKGKKMVTYEIVMKNGREVSKKAIQTVVTKKPSKQVETVGAKPNFSGDFADALAKLRACEAGGNYANKNNPLYRGAYQFSYSTWANKYGIYDPADASPAQQDQAARELYLRRGWQPWPHCGASLPDTFR